MCVPEQIRTFCFSPKLKTPLGSEQMIVISLWKLATHTPTRLPLESKLSYWAVIRQIHWVIRGHVTWPRWGTALSSPPASATHPAASCREPGGSEGPPLWSCRWPGRRWSRSGGTISALRSTGNNFKISVSSKLQYFLSCGQRYKGIVSNSAWTLTTILLMLLQRSEFGAASWHFSSNNNNNKGHGRCWSPTQQSARLSGSSKDTRHLLARYLESPSIIHDLCRRKPDHENGLTLSENHSRFDSLWKVNIP